MGYKLIWAIFLTSFFTVRGLHSNAQSNNQMSQTEGQPESSSFTDVDSLTTSLGCKPELWHYVYDPGRLEIKKKCISVTGTIVGSNADEDGDQHMLLKLDNQVSLLTKKNVSKKDGNLVIEAICINNIRKKKAMGACNGYVNHVQLPKVGDHVKVTGSYVIDTHNGWAEIHPITEIILQ
ncbi:MAG: hypothetical protein ABJA57_03810 [Ginsengibacter sp.]